MAVSPHAHDRRPFKNDNCTQFNIFVDWFTIMTGHFPIVIHEIFQVWFAINGMHTAGWASTIKDTISNNYALVTIGIA